MGRAAGPRHSRVCFWEPCFCDICVCHWGALLQSKFIDTHVDDHALTTTMSERCIDGLGFTKCNEIQSKLGTLASCCCGALHSSGSS